MHITRATWPDDRAVLQPHFAACWRDTYGALLGPDGLSALLATLDSADMAGLAPGNGEVILTANAPDGALLGTLICATRGGIGYVWGMYVAAQAQRMGLGKSLFAKAMLWHADAAGFEVIALSQSTQALRFYQSLGFRQDATLEHEIVPGHRHTAQVLQCDRQRLALSLTAPE